MTKNNNNTDKRVNEQEQDFHPHREHQLYSFYADELLAHAEATKADAEKQRQEKGTDEGRI